MSLFRGYAFPEGGIVPETGVAYYPVDELTLACPPNLFIRLVFLDWDGSEQERAVGRGTWPIRSTVILGYRSVEYGAGGRQWGPLRPIEELGDEVEITVGPSASQLLPRQLRRAR